MKGPGPGQRSLLLFALAVAVRSIPFVRVFEPANGGVQPFGSDALYHLRRVLFTLANFPHGLDFDRYMAFPFGAQPIWPPLFDWVLALVAWPVYTGASPEQARSVEALLVWIPPLLGAASVALLYRLARRLYDETVAWVSALVLAVLPGHFWYSQLGFIDHHAAVALLFVALLGATARLLADLERGTGSGPAIALGALLAASLLVWPGSLLQLLLVEGFAIATGLACTDLEAARRHARALALANGVAAGGVAPFAFTHWIHWSEFSPAVLSFFQPWLLALLAIHAASCALAWRRGFGTSRGRRIGESAVVALVLAGLSLWLFPGLLAGMSEGARWLLRDEAFQAVVAESRPLFQGANGFEVAIAENRLTRFVYLAPIAALAMLLVRRSDPDAHGVRLVGAAILVLGVVTLLQRRFFNSWSVVVALAIGYGGVSAWRFLAARLRGRRRALAGVALVAAWVWAFAPIRGSYQLPLRNTLQVLRGEEPSLPASLRRERQLAAAAVWLRGNSPPTSGFLDASQTPEYAVLALWTHGHLIEYRARRPSVANNFGDDLGETGFLASYRFFQAGTDEARRLAADLGVGYVLLRTTPAGAPDRLPESSMQQRLSGPPESLRDLDWLSPVYDRPLDAAQEGRIRIFEVHRPAPGG